MDFKNKLLAYGKKIITLEDLAVLLTIETADTKTMFDIVSGLINDVILEPVKSSGQNGNRKYPMFKKYRILIKEEFSAEAEKQIRQLHPVLRKSGYLSSHLQEYLKHKEVIDSLNTYLFSKKAEEPI